MENNGKTTWPKLKWNRCRGCRVMKVAKCVASERTRQSQRILET